LAECHAHPVAVRRAASGRCHRSDGGCGGAVGRPSGAHRLPRVAPAFTLELEDARRLLQAERSPALGPADRRFLRAVLDTVQAALSTLATANQPLHGSPHAGNWLATAEGPLLLDFETACRGPIEWDLAALDDEAVDLFPGVDDELIALLRRLRSVCVAAKCWVELNRAPRCPRRRTST
jgi:hypothetical protein